MVRQKSRWLVVRVEWSPGQSGVRLIDDDDLTRQQLVQAIRENMAACFGVAANGAMYDTQGKNAIDSNRILPKVVQTDTTMPVRVWDAGSRLALIRTPLEYCGTVRAALTLLTVLKRRRVVVTTRSVHGSARTAKLGMLRALRQAYRKAVLEQSTSKDKLCRQLDECLASIYGVGY